MVSLLRAWCALRRASTRVSRRQTRVSAPRLLLMAVAVCSAAAADDADFASLVRQIGAAVDSPHAMSTMRSVWETDRWFTFSKFHETARYLKARLLASGLRDVEILEAPA